jgi:acetyltransferase-like isoleucine patch superfamily enzyme
MVNRIAFAMLRVLFHLLYGSKPHFSIKKNIKYFNTFIKVHPSSSIEIGNNATLLNNNITVGPNCKLIIQDNTVFKNLNLALKSNSIVEVKKGAILDYSFHHKGEISVESGQLVIGEKANIKANIFIRFNGYVLFGKHTGIGHHSEIVCDERIEFGDYCLISNHVSLYDTNSHSTHFISRRKRIEEGYPSGCSEIEKPLSSNISIGNDVWIGKNATVLKGAIIGDRCIVGMSTTVTKGTYPVGSYIVSEKPRVIKEQL